MTEYIKLSGPEIIYGQKNLLQSQLSLLQAIKHYAAYQGLRKYELLLKISLKNKIEQIKKTLTLLGKLLPKIKFIESHVKETKKIKDVFDKKDFSLEREIEQIRKKLSQIR